MNVSLRVTAPGLALVILLGVLGGAGAYTFVYAEGLSYVSDDPTVCVNCHIMREQFDGWQKATHHTRATCNECHLPHSFFSKYFAKARNGFFHSKAFTLQNFEEPIRIHEWNARRLQANCIECHEDMVSMIRWSAGSRREELDCARCHATAGHGASG